MVLVFVKWYFILVMNMCQNEMWQYWDVVWFFYVVGIELNVIFFFDEVILLEIIYVYVCFDRIINV